MITCELYILREVD